jgi:hypothetical protein
MGRYGVFAGGQLVNPDGATLEEAEEIASDVRADNPDMPVEVDVITFKMLACVTDGMLTPHTRINETEWECDHCQSITTIREDEQ